MSNTLQGQVAFITGGSRGIGGAIARAFARAGADVGFCHLDDAEGAAETARAIAAAGRRGFARACDVADAAALRATIAEAEATLGPTDILVCNAGINIRGAFETLDDSVFDRLLAVHLKGTIAACRAVYPGMAARGRGRIITLSSQLALKGGAGVAPYVTAKAAVLGFTRALALEAAPKGIRVNAIAPGPVDTDLTRARGAEWRRAIEAALPAGRLGRPEEIAETALLLAGPGGAFYVGACLSPNGGDILH
ncbi:short-chain dehydrogenase/reductase [Caldovatus sediminis]|uniref:Short-chain dehydrogenase/reductase n=1 Tax=Caldovatus sediminis TaxID=2041189 RepID=A0A8J2ZAS6_9PROT|nr:SDR family NAD(P)-dependent oxidoreductase [Caldovatus sediminis]GGG29851.1 short-chain dehydrogenase/reductase [Caldovatus sediminis]